MSSEKYKICPACGEHNPPALLECRKCETDLTGVKIVDGASRQADTSVQEPASEYGQCKNERIRISRMSSVIDLYKYGIRENPWDTLEENELKHAYEDFRKRIKGQDYAITKTLDVVKRAVTGMAGLQSSSHTRPKGILFFAGPTGTGKTETAKTLAEKSLGNLANGARGIGNMVESLLINPLSRYLFDNGIKEDARLVIQSIDTESMPSSLNILQEV